MDHVPVVIIGDGMVGFEAGVCLDDCKLGGKKLVNMYSASVRNRVMG